MKIALIVVLAIVIIVLLFAVLIKSAIKRMQLRNLNLLQSGYLGETIEAIRNWINLQPSEKFISQYENDDIKYIITTSESKETTKIYQFSNNICTGFYIESSDKSYSLPSSFIYRANFNKINKKSLTGLNPDVGFGYYLKEYFLYPYKETKVQFKNSSDSVFKEYYEVGKERYLSIELDVEKIKIFKRPVYKYLCASQPDFLKLFRKSLSESDNLNNALRSTKSVDLITTNSLDKITLLTDYSTYGFPDLQPREKEFVIKIFKLINETITDHCNYVNKVNPKRVSDDKLFLKKTSLEIASHYWVYLTQDFAKKNVDENVGHVIMTTFLEYFSDLNAEILKNGHKDFLDFVLNRRSNAIRIIQDNRFDTITLGYFEQIFIYEPMIKTHPYERRISSFRLDNVVGFAAYFSKLNEEISKNSFDTVGKYF